MDKLIIGLVAIALLGVGYLFLQGQKPNPQLDTFAQCLKDKGAIFYGTFWCPHCQNQKKLFGSSQQYLPYIECSTADGKGQLQICQDKQIKGYPTWEFSDGSRESGELTFQKLAEKTNCELPK